jgi:hypothetical protein
VKRVEINILGAPIFKLGTSCIMDQQLNKVSKLNLIRVGVAKASFKRAIVYFIRLEAKWANHEQVDTLVRTEP